MESYAELDPLDTGYSRGTRQGYSRGTHGVLDRGTHGVLTGYSTGVLTGYSPQDAVRMETDVELDPLDAFMGDVVQQVK